MSSGNASTTGPGRPEIAMLHARATYSGMRAASSIFAAHFTTGPNIAGKSISWNASRSFVLRSTSPMNSTIGCESCIATCTPIEAFVAPGPRVTKATPGRPVSAPSAQAMKPTPPSCRHTTKSISGVSWSASSTARKLSPGTVKIRSQPCATSWSTRIRPPVRGFVMAPVVERIAAKLNPLCRVAECRKILHDRSGAKAC
jgi:hypothetical protein